MSYLIIVFKNTHDAMKAETVILEKNFKIRIMPTPTSITQSCGICVRLDEKEKLEEVLALNFEYKAVYERNEGGYILIKNWEE